MGSNNGEQTFWEPLESMHFNIGTIYTEVSTPYKAAHKILVNFDLINAKQMYVREDLNSVSTDQITRTGSPSKNKTKH